MQSSTPHPTGNNLLGALIFYGYIAAALLITSLIVKDIVLCSYRSKSVTHAQSVDVRDQTDSKTRHAGTNSNETGATSIVFAGLALVSFTVISWNMLNFLIASYTAWSRVQNRPFEHHQSFSTTQFRAFLASVWLWSTDSNLFQSFAEDLVRDSETWTQVRLALLYSYLWNLWMSMLGQQLGVRRLWTYFILDQILPASFTQNLFLTAVCISSKDQKVKLRLVLTERLMLSTGYLLCLWLVSHTISTSWFLPLILVLRALLSTPFVVDWLATLSSNIEPDRSGPKVRIYNIVWFSLFIAYTAYTILHQPSLSDKDHGARERNYAARALTDDMLLGILSGAIHVTTGPVQKL